MAFGIDFPELAGANPYTGTTSPEVLRVTRETAAK